MFNFLKNYWLLIALATIAVLLFSAKVYVSLKPGDDRKTHEISWNGITPGESTVNDVAGRLGNPVSTREGNTGAILEYQSGVGSLKNQVYTQNNKVGLVKEQVWGKENLVDYKNKYGAPEGEYYGDYQQSGYKVYVYPSQGLSVIAHTEDGYVLEKWYFKPLSLPEFLASWGKELTTEPEEHF